MINFLKAFWISFFLLIATSPLTLANAQESTLSEIESGKVILSWKEFKQLLDEMESLKETIKQEKEKKEKKTEAPPVDYSITRADYKGTIEKSFARLDADFSVHVLKQGWVMIPFFSRDIGIESVSVQTSASPEAKPHSDADSPEPQNRSAAYFERAEKGYRLIAKGPAIIHIRTAVSIPVQVVQLSHNLSFELPNSVINTIELRFRDKGVNIMHASPRGEILQEADETVFKSVLAKGNAVKIGWNIEKDTGILRKSAATLHALASISKSSMTLHTRVLLRHIASFERLELSVPREVEILSVTSPKIDRWTTETRANHQIIKLSGHPERHAATAVVLTYRLKITSLPRQIRVPVVKIKGADGFEGFLGVEILDNLEVLTDKIEKGDLIPPKNLPGTLWETASSPILFGCHFYSDAFDTTLNIKSYQDVQTVIANVDLAVSTTHRTLEGKSITRIKYFIRNNDRQFLTLSLPENSRIWQTFLDGRPVKPARKESGEILIPMKKSSSAQGEELKSFSIEMGYITDVDKLSLKGDILNELPKIDIPASYLQWKLYLPEYYEYSGFQGPLKQVARFTGSASHAKGQKFQIEIPARGKQFLFEKYLIVDEMPYVRSKYGQHLGDNIFLTVQPYPSQRRHVERKMAPIQQRITEDKLNMEPRKPALRQQQITPNYWKK